MLKVSKLLVGSGHGGQDPGAVSGKKIERDLARLFEAELLKQAKARGLNVVSVTDNDSSLTNDIQRANQYGGDLAIQFHWNSTSGSQAGKKLGAEAWYDNLTKKDTIATADALSKNFNAYYKLPNRKSRPDTDDRLGRLGWTSDTKMPAILFELGFINADDCDIILADLPGGANVLLDTIFGVAKPASTPTPAPTPAPAPAKKQMPTIQYGSRGPEVKVWQEYLIAHGYKLPRYGADGDFGQEVRAATIKYQKDHGLAPDSIVGPITWKSAGY